MKTYRYRLDNSRPTKLFHCEGCGKKTLKRYVDTQTGDYLPLEVGRCNRELNCGYHFTPNEYFVQNPNLKPKETNSFVAKQEIAAPPSFLPSGLVLESLKSYQQNHFVSYLHTLFEKEKVENLIELYRIGTSKHWKGASVFWQIDEDEKVRTGKIMLYDAQSGKRVKKPYNHIQWVHSVLKCENFELAQCFFGSHLLLKYPHQTVAIVESEKTAIIARGFVPDCLWLGSGGLSQLNTAKWWHLRTRNVILYPDLGGFEKWKEKAEMLQKNCNAKIIVSDILEKNATQQDRENGLDIADFLIRDFQQKQQVKPLPKIEGLLADMVAQNPTLLRLIETFSLVNINVNPLEKPFKTVK